MMTNARLPEHVSAVLPKASHVFTISPAERAFVVRVFWRGALVETMPAATLPEAQAASCRAAGVPHSPSSTEAGMAPRCPWRANSSPNAG